MNYSRVEVSCFKKKKKAYGKKSNKKYVLIFFLASLEY